MKDYRIVINKMNMVDKYKDFSVSDMNEILELTEEIIKDKKQNMLKILVTKKAEEMFKVIKNESCSECDIKHFLIEFTGEVRGILEL